jgi:hypothetical protein
MEDGKMNGKWMANGWKLENDGRWMENGWKMDGWKMDGKWMENGWQMVHSVFA